MARKELKDSKELRAAIADLESRKSNAQESIRLEEIEEEPYDPDDYPPESYDQDDYLDDSFGEEIENDSFEDRINDTASLEGIGEAIAEQERQRRQERELSRAAVRERKAVREQERVPSGRSHSSGREREREREYYEEEPEYKPVKKTEKRGKKRHKKNDDVIISLEGVSKSYVKGVPALNNVNIKIRRGEFVFIVGGSGSGKSTLIRLLLRELQPTCGQIMVNGYRVDNMRRSKIPMLRRSIGVVFQDFRLLHDRNVYENVAFAQRVIQAPLREMKRNVPDMLATVGLAGKYKAKPEELSGGEQQRVALARALVNRPPILLCDEPTGNLDPRMTTEIMNLLDRINKNGTTVVVVTHNDKIVNDMQKRVITIKKGVIISDEEKGVYLDED